MTATTPPPLPADLTDGLKRLKMAAMRQLAPELLVTAKTQRWKPEEFLRTLVEAEITARDASNARTRLKQAVFPVTKTLDEFDVGASSIPQATFDYLASLEWVRAAENVCLIGPAGTGKSHVLVALGIAAVEAGHRVRYFTAADLVETLYRGLADNSVGKLIDTLLRNDLVLVDEFGLRSIGRHRCAAAVPVRRGCLREALAGHRVALALRVLGTVPARTHHRGQHARSAPPPLPHRRHGRRLLPDEASPSEGRNPHQDQLKVNEEWGLLVGHQRGPRNGR